MVPAPEVIEAPLPPPPLVPATPESSSVGTRSQSATAMQPPNTAVSTSFVSGPAGANSGGSGMTGSSSVAPPTGSVPRQAPNSVGSSSATSVAPQAAPLPPPITPQSASPAPDTVALQAPPAPARAVAPQAEQVAKEPEPDFPLWQVSALGTATLPTALDGSAFLIGARAELDVWRIGVLVTVDQAGTTPFSLSSAQQWTALGGYAVLVNKWARLRLLGGVSGASTTSLSPTIGANVRVGWSFLGAEAAAVLTPFGSAQQLDLRAEGILRGGIFELHAGYRARFLDTTGAGLLTSALLAGPHVAVGLAF